MFEKAEMFAESVTAADALRSNITLQKLIYKYVRQTNPFFAGMSDEWSIYDDLSEHFQDEWEQMWSCNVEVQHYVMLWYESAR